MKNKNIIIAMGVIIVALIGVVIYLLVKENNNANNDTNDKPEITDASKFADEYTELTDDNVFVYASADEIIDTLENGNGIVYLGFPECQWCQRYVVYLNDVAKENNVDKILYYNIREDRNDNSENYLKIVDLLKDYLQDDEDGNPRIYVPAIIFMNDGKIVGFDDETSLDTKGCSNADEYWTKDEIKDLKERLNEYIEKANVCIDCNS